MTDTELHAGNAADERTADSTTGAAGVFTRKLPLEHETALYLLVSVLDFFLTYWMLMHRQGDGAVFEESNPVARFFLNHWGLRGMLGFKLAACLFVILITQIIAGRRPLAAIALLWLGTIVSAVTVLYSFSMYVRHSGGAGLSSF